MRYCQYCGSVLSQYAKYCPSCGAEAEESPSEDNKSPTQTYYTVNTETPCPKKQHSKIVTALKIVAVIFLLILVTFIVEFLIDSYVASEIIRYTLYIIIIYYFFLKDHILTSLRKWKAKLENKGKNNSDKG